jgi:hypothetical protein
MAIELTAEQYYISSDPERSGLVERADQQQQGLVTVQGDVEIDRHRQTVDRIANQDCLAGTLY